MASGLVSARTSSWRGGARQDETRNGPASHAHQRSRPIAESPALTGIVGNVAIALKQFSARQAEFDLVFLQAG